jgi:hypothetical protein
VELASNVRIIEIINWSVSLFSKDKLKTFENLDITDKLGELEKKAELGNQRHEWKQGRKKIQINFNIKIREY